MGVSVKEMCMDWAGGVRRFAIPSTQIQFQSHVARLISAIGKSLREFPHACCPCVCMHGCMCVYENKLDRGLCGSVCSYFFGGCIHTLAGETIEYVLHWCSVDHMVLCKNQLWGV